MLILNTDNVESVAINNNSLLCNSGSINIYI